MDPLDQRLTDAGAAWRQSQPEPPDLDRMTVALRRRPARLFPGRLMYAFAASLLLVVAVGLAPAVGGFLHELQATVPVKTATPSPTISHAPASAAPTPASPAPSTPASPGPSASMSDRDTATNLVDRYEASLVAGQWETAFDLLAPTSPTHQAGVAAFASERAPYFESVAGRYTVGKPSPVTDWTSYAPLVAGADRSRAYLIEVDYPALANNNAGYEQFVVAPDAAGTWRIWPVR